VRQALVVPVLTDPSCWRADSTETLLSAAQRFSAWAANLQRREDIVVAEAVVCAIRSVLSERGLSA
jgi:hypothetical protein